MPFIADAMLGKLARWLRILGFDTAYSSSLTDEELVRKAVCEGRTLLTRDADLHKMASRLGARSFLIRGHENHRILQEISPLLTDPSPASRCPACNSPLEPKSTATNPLPTPGSHPCWRCPSCGKLYWHGAHWKGIKRTLLLAGLGDLVGNS